MSSEEYLDTITYDEDYESKQEKKISYYLKVLAKANMETCPICKKAFYVSSSQWAYKDNHKYFCSWHCLRKYQKEHSSKEQHIVIPESVNRRFSPEKIKAVKEEIKKHKLKGDYNPHMIAIKLGCSTTTIRKYAKDV